MLWHIIAFSIMVSILLIQQWEIVKMGKRIRGNEEIINKIRQGVLLCLRGPGRLPEVDDFIKECNSTIENK